MLQAGVPVTTVNARLGHSLVSTTTDYYLHDLPGDSARAAEAVAAVQLDAERRRDPYGGEYPATAGELKLARDPAREGVPPPAA